MIKKVLISFLAIFICILPALSSDLQVDEAQKLYNKKKYQQALNLINLAIESENKYDEKAYKLRADIYLKLNLPIEAIKDLSSAIKLSNNTDSDAFFKRANVYLQIKDYDMAILNFYCSQKLFGNEYYKIVKKQLKNFINDTNIPISSRINACYCLRTKMTISPSSEYLAAYFKEIQLVNLLPDNFVSKRNGKTKKYMLDEYKMEIDNLPKTTLEEIIMYYFIFGFYTYAFGNKITIAKNSIDMYEKQFPQNSDVVKEMNEEFYYIKNILDNGFAED